MPPRAHRLGEMDMEVRNKVFSVDRTRVRVWVGRGIACVGAIVLLAQFGQYVRANPVVLSALMGGSVAALATALGTLPVLFSQRLSDRVQDTLFGFGAGVMLAASAFSHVERAQRPRGEGDCSGPCAT